MKQQVSEPIRSLQVSERITAGFAVALKVNVELLDNTSMGQSHAGRTGAYYNERGSGFFFRAGPRSGLIRV
jgi:hypothetical protein